MQTFFDCIECIFRNILSNALKLKLFVYTLHLRKIFTRLRDANIITSFNLCKRKFVFAFLKIYWIGMHCVCIFNPLKMRIEYWQSFIWSCLPLQLNNQSNIWFYWMKFTNSFIDSKLKFHIHQKPKIKLWIFTKYNLTKSNHIIL